MASFDNANLIAESKEVCEMALNNKGRPENFANKDGRLLHVINCMADLFRQAEAIEMRRGESEQASDDIYIDWENEWMKLINLKTTLEKRPYTFTDEEVLMLLILKMHASSENELTPLQIINVYVDRSKKGVSDIKMLTNVAAESYDLLLKILNTE